MNQVEIVSVEVLNNTAGVGCYELLRAVVGRLDVMVDAGGRSATARVRAEAQRQQ